MITEFPAPPSSENGPIFNLDAFLSLSKTEGAKKKKVQKFLGSRTIFTVEMVETARKMYENGEFGEGSRQQLKYHVPPDFYDPYMVRIPNSNWQYNPAFIMEHPRKIPNDTPRKLKRFSIFSCKTKLYYKLKNKLKKDLKRKQERVEKLRKNLDRIGVNFTRPVPTCLIKLAEKWRKGRKNVQLWKPWQVRLIKLGTVYRRPEAPIALRTPRKKNRLKASPRSGSLPSNTRPTIETDKQRENRKVLEIKNKMCASMPEGQIKDMEENRKKRLENDKELDPEYVKAKERKKKDQIKIKAQNKARDKAEWVYGIRLNKVPELKNRPAVPELDVPEDVDLQCQTCLEDIVGATVCQEVIPKLAHVQPVFDVYNSTWMPRLVFKKFENKAEEEELVDELIDLVEEIIPIEEEQTPLFAILKSCTLDPTLNRKELWWTVPLVPFLIMKLLKRRTPSEGVVRSFPPAHSMTKFKTFLATNMHPLTGKMTLGHEKYECLSFSQLKGRFMLEFSRREEHLLEEEELTGKAKPYRSIVFDLEVSHPPRGSRKRWKRDMVAYCREEAGKFRWKETEVDWDALPDFIYAEDRNEWEKEFEKVIGRKKTAEPCSVPPGPLPSRESSPQPPKAPYRDLSHAEVIAKYKTRIFRINKINADDELSYQEKREEIERITEDLDPEYLEHLTKRHEPKQCKAPIGDLEAKTAWKNRRALESLEARKYELPSKEAYLEELERTRNNFDDPGASCSYEVRPVYHKEYKRGPGYYSEVKKINEFGWEYPISSPDEKSRRYVYETGERLEDVRDALLLYLEVQEIMKVKEEQYDRDQRAAKMYSSCKKKERENRWKSDREEKKAQAEWEKEQELKELAEDYEEAEYQKIQKALEEHNERRLEIDKKRAEWRQKREKEKKLGGVKAPKRTERNRDCVPRFLASELIYEEKHDKDDERDKEEEEMQIVSQVNQDAIEQPVRDYESPISLSPLPTKDFIPEKHFKDFYEGPLTPNEEDKEEELNHDLHVNAPFDENETHHYSSEEPEILQHNQNALMSPCGIYTPQSPPQVPVKADCEDSMSRKEPENPGEPNVQVTQQEHHPESDSREDSHERHPENGEIDGQDKEPRVSLEAEDNEEVAQDDWENEEDPYCEPAPRVSPELERSLSPSPAPVSSTESSSSPDRTPSPAPLSPNAQFALELAALNNIEDRDLDFGSNDGNSSQYLGNEGSTISSASKESIADRLLSEEPVAPREMQYTEEDLLGDPDQFDEAFHNVSADGFIYKTTRKDLEPEAVLEPDFSPAKESTSEVIQEGVSADGPQRRGPSSPLVHHKAVKKGKTVDGSSRGNKRKLIFESDIDRPLRSPEHPFEKIDGLNRQPPPKKRRGRPKKTANIPLARVQPKRGVKKVVEVDRPVEESIEKQAVPEEEETVVVVAPMVRTDIAGFMNEPDPVQDFSIDLNLYIPTIARTISISTNDNEDLLLAEPEGDEINERNYTVDELLGDREQVSEDEPELETIAPEDLEAEIVEPEDVEQEIVEPEEVEPEVIEPEGECPGEVETEPVEPAKVPKKRGRKPKRAPPTCRNTRKKKATPEIGETGDPVPVRKTRKPRTLDTDTISVISENSTRSKRHYLSTNNPKPRIRGMIPNASLGSRITGVAPKEVPQESIPDADDNDELLENFLKLTKKTAPVVQEPVEIILEDGPANENTDPIDAPISAEVKAEPPDGEWMLPPPHTATSRKSRKRQREERQLKMNNDVKQELFGDPPPPPDPDFSIISHQIKKIKQENADEDCMIVASNYRVQHDPVQVEPEPEPAKIIVEDDLNSKPVHRLLMTRKIWQEINEFFKSDPERFCEISMMLEKDSEKKGRVFKKDASVINRISQFSSKFIKFMAESPKTISSDYKNLTDYNSFTAGIRARTSLILSNHYVTPLMLFQVVEKIMEIRKTLRQQCSISLIGEREREAMAATENILLGRYIENVMKLTALSQVPWATETHVKRRIELIYNGWNMFIAYGGFFRILLAFDRPDVKPISDRFRKYCSDYLDDIESNYKKAVELYEMTDDMLLEHICKLAGVTMDQVTQLDSDVQRESSKSHSKKCSRCFIDEKNVYFSTYDLLEIHEKLHDAQSRECETCFDEYSAPHFVLHRIIQHCSMKDKEDEDEC